MAAADKCGGCKELTSYICAAQFCNGSKEHLIICPDCWKNGERCWLTPNGLEVSRNEPPNSKLASLYWDEGGFVTGGILTVTYPSKDQNE